MGGCELPQPNPAALRFPLRLLVQGRPSMACPFGSAKAHWAFANSPPHPWSGAQRRECTLSAFAKAPASPLAVLDIGPFRMAGHEDSAPVLPNYSVSARPGGGCVKCNIGPGLPPTARKNLPPHRSKRPAFRKAAIWCVTVRENSMPVCDTGNARCSCAAEKALSFTVSRPSFGRGRPRYNQRPKPKEQVPQIAPISRGGDIHCCGSPASSCATPFPIARRQKTWRFRCCATRQPPCGVPSVTIRPGFRRGWS